MRYVANHDQYDAETLLLAETLFERFIGRRLVATMYDERVKVVQHRCKLAHTPVVGFLSIKAVINAGVVFPWAMNSEIVPDDVLESDGNLALPPSLFSVSYDEAHVTYIAGYEAVPTDIEACVVELYDLLRSGGLTEWSGVQALSADAQSTIARYRSTEPPTAYRGGDR